MGTRHQFQLPGCELFNICYMLIFDHQNIGRYHLISDLEDRIFFTLRFQTNYLEKFSPLASIRQASSNGFDVHDKRNNMQIK